MNLLLFSEHIVIISLKNNESLSFIMVMYVFCEVGSGRLGVICMNNQCSILIFIYIFFNEKDNRAKPGNLPEGVALSEIRAFG